jgi:hypothetical protein
MQELAMQIAAERFVLRAFFLAMAKSIILQHNAS